MNSRLTRTRAMTGLGCIAWDYRLDGRYIGRVGKRFGAWLAGSYKVPFATRSAAADFLMRMRDAS